MRKMLRILPGLEPRVKSHVSCDDVTRSEGPGPATSEDSCSEGEATVVLVCRPLRPRRAPSTPSWSLALRFLSLFICQAAKHSWQLPFPSLPPPPRAGGTDDGLQMSVLCQPREQGLPFGDWHCACPVQAALSSVHFTHASQLFPPFPPPPALILTSPEDMVLFCLFFREREGRARETLM